MEKSAKILMALNQPAYIAWKANCKVYKQKNGLKRMVELIDSSIQEFCALFICEQTLAELLLIENSELTSILDQHFDVENASNYETTLSALYMKPKDFCRADIEDYCTTFLGTLLTNPTFVTRRWRSGSRNH